MQLPEQPKAGAGRESGPWLLFLSSVEVRFGTVLSNPSRIFHMDVPDPILKSGSLIVRRVEQSDIRLLTRWLSTNEVLAFYGGRDKPYDAGRISEEFFQRDGIIRCIVEWEGVPIGYIQFYRCEPKENLDYGFATTESVWGMDQFIGETGYWNKGIGSRLVREMAEYLLSRGAAHVVTDPETWNTRAIRAYQKAGFLKVKLLPRHEWHEGEMRDSWLMEYKRT